MTAFPAFLHWIKARFILTWHLKTGANENVDIGSVLQDADHKTHYCIIAVTFIIFGTTNLQKGKREDTLRRRIRELIKQKVKGLCDNAVMMIVTWISIPPWINALIHPSIHPSIHAYSICRWVSSRLCRVSWRPPQQLYLAPPGGAEAFPCQMRQQILGLPWGFLPVGRAKRTSIGSGGFPIRSLNHLKWLLLVGRSSGYQTYHQMSELFTLSLNAESGHPVEEINFGNLYLRSQSFGHY